MTMRCLASMSCVLLLSACPSDDGGGMESSSTGTDTDSDASTGTTAPLTTSGMESSSEESSSDSSSGEPLGEFDSRIQPIFDDRCSCHLTSVGSGGLSLQAGMAYANLVGVPSAGAPSLTRVVAGDSSMSYLIMKLEDTHLGNGGVGSQMPLGGILDDATIQEIAAWIDEGAPE